jgi:hypothetical protein
VDHSSDIKGGVYGLECGRRAKEVQISKENGRGLLVRVLRYWSCG